MRNVGLKINFVGLNWICKKETRKEKDSLCLRRAPAESSYANHLTKLNLVRKNAISSNISHIKSDIFSSTKYIFVRHLYDAFHFKTEIVLDRPSRMSTKLFLNFIRLYLRTL
jgi:hypothetical protein